jgi:hypothetical protein
LRGMEPFFRQKRQTVAAGDSGQYNASISQPD